MNIEKVKEGLLQCEHTDCCDCPYNDVTSPSCMNGLLQEALNVIHYFEKNAISESDVVLTFHEVMNEVLNKIEIPRWVYYAFRGIENEVVARLPIKQKPQYTDEDIVSEIISHLIDAIEQKATPLCGTWVATRSDVLEAAEKVKECQFNEEKE